MQGFSEAPLGVKALAGLLALLLVGVVWSMLASVVFLAGTGLLAGHHGLPVTEWWSYWQHYGLQHPAPVGWFGMFTLGQWLKASAAFATLVPTVFAFGLPLAIEEIRQSERTTK